MKSGMALSALFAMNLPRPALSSSGKVLVVSSPVDIPNYDPHLAFDDPALMVQRNCYEALTRFVGLPPVVEPQLAKSWTTSEDGKTYTFELFREARFQDGSPITAAAVKYSLDRILKIGRGITWMFQGIVDPQGIEVKDDHTLVVRLLHAYAPFVNVLTYAHIVNPALVEPNEGSDFGQTYLRTNLAGSGPFSITRAEPGNLYEFQRVEHWREAEGNVDRAIWMVMRETSARRLAVARGEAHFALDMTDEDLNAVKGTPGVETVNEPGYRTFTIKMNTKFGPLADINLRKAISYAMDYDAMLPIGGQGTQLLQGPLLSAMIGHDDGLEVYRNNPERAKEYLAKSAYPNGGIRLKMVYVPGVDQWRQWGLVLLSSLRSLGIELDLVPTPWPDAVAAAANPETCPDLFPAYMGAYFGTDPDSLAYAGYHSSRNGSYQNPTYSNPEVDALVARAREVSDVAEREKLYRDFQRIVVGDAPVIFGVADNRRLIKAAGVTGYEYTSQRGNSVDLAPLTVV